METNFTPEPWWRDDDGFIAAGSGDTYVTIADFDCSKDIDVDEREANKTLCIMAPEMFKMCEKIKDWWEEHQYDFGVSDGEEYNVFDEEPCFVTEAKKFILKLNQDETI